MVSDAKEKILGWLEELLKKMSSLAITVLAKYLGISDEIKVRLNKEEKIRLAEKVYQKIIRILNEGTLEDKKKVERIQKVFSLYLDLGGKRLISKSKFLHLTESWISQECQQILEKIQLIRVSIETIVAMLLTNDSISDLEICHALMEASIEGADPRVRYSEEVIGEFSQEFLLQNLKHRENKEKVWREINERLASEFRVLSVQLHKNPDLGISVNEKEKSILFLIVLKDRYARQPEFRSIGLGAKLENKFVPLGKIRIIKVKFLGNNKAILTTNLDLRRRRDKRIWRMITSMIIRKKHSKPLAISRLSHKLLQNLIKKLIDDAIKNNAANAAQIFNDFLNLMKQKVSEFLEKQDIENDLKEKLLAYIESLKLSKIKLEYSKGIRLLEVRVIEAGSNVLIGLANILSETDLTEKSHIELELKGNFPITDTRRQQCYISILSDGIKVPQGLDPKACEILQGAIEYAIKVLCEQNEG